MSSLQIIYGMCRTLIYYDPMAHYRAHKWFSNVLLGYVSLTKTFTAAALTVYRPHRTRLCSKNPLETKPARQRASGGGLTDKPEAAATYIPGASLDKSMGRMDAIYLNAFCTPQPKDLHGVR